MSDWGGFGGIIKEAQAVAENPPPVVACPRCGELLVENKRLNVKACPRGDWREGE